jgi:hypothetical protein
MTADSTCLEEITITMPLPILEDNCMRIVVAIESYREFVKSNPVTFFCIPLGFFDLSDHPVVHCDLPLKASFVFELAGISSIGGKKQSTQV